MKSYVMLAVIAALGAPAAMAQDGQQGSLRLLTASAPPAEAPATAPPVSEPSPAIAPPPVAETPAPAEPAAAPAPAAAAPAATGWTGPVNFAPVAVADLITRVCRPSIAGDGGDLLSRAVALGLGGPQPAPEDLARALAPGAVVWEVPTIDGDLHLVGTGEAPLSCGVAVLRPMPEEGFNRVLGLLQSAEHGFTQDSTQMLPGDIRWVRLRSPKGEFVDLMEYPTRDDAPGVLRADFLPG